MPVTDVILLEAASAPIHRMKGLDTHLMIYQLSFRITRTHVIGTLIKIRPVRHFHTLSSETCYIARLS